MCGWRGDEASAVAGFGLDEPVWADEVAGLEPVGDVGVVFEPLELPCDADAVDAVFGDEVGGGEGEAFGLAHAGFEGDGEHEGPHFVVSGAVPEHAPFALGRGQGRLDGPQGLAGVKDSGFRGLIARGMAASAGLEGMSFSRTAASRICLSLMK